MGQQVPCLIYGCPAPRDIDLALWDDDNPEQGVIERYEREFGWSSVPTTTPDSHVNILGYEIGHLAAYAGIGVPLSHVLDGELNRLAREKWAAFSAWVAREYGVVLPTPDTYVALCEVA